MECERSRFTTVKHFAFVWQLAHDTADAELIRIVDAVTVDPTDEVVRFAPVKADLPIRIEEIRKLVTGQV